MTFAICIDCGERHPVGRHTKPGVVTHDELDLMRAAGEGMIERESYRNTEALMGATFDALSQTEARR